jgi:hypothetical protein
MECMLVLYNECLAFSCSKKEYSDRQLHTRQTQAMQMTTEADLPNRGTKPSEQRSLPELIALYSTDETCT